MKKELFYGVGTALVTPFADGGVDYACLRRLARYQADHGADALVVCGTTGEAPTLTEEERLQCIATVVDEVGGQLPVIAGTTGNDTDRSVRLSRLAAEAGVDAILAVTPYYNRPTPDGLIRHFLSVAEGAGKPTLLYNIPSRTGCMLTNEVYDALAPHPLIAGVKEASGSISRAAELVLRYGEALPLYSGNDDQVLPTLAVGGRGVVSVASNLLPAEVHSLCSLWSEGKTAEALALYQSLLPLMNALFLETNPIPVKAGMAYLGFCSDQMRLPMTPAREQTIKEVVRALVPLLG